MRASMEDFISALLGGTHLASSVLTSPSGIKRSDGHYCGQTEALSSHLVQTLLYDTQALSHLRHPHQISVITVSVAPHGNIEVDKVIGVIRLGLSQVVLDSLT